MRREIIPAARPRVRRWATCDEPRTPCTDGIPAPGRKRKLGIDFDSGHSLGRDPAISHGLGRGHRIVNHPVHRSRPVANHVAGVSSIATKTFDTKRSDFSEVAGPLRSLGICAASGWPPCRGSPTQQLIETLMVFWLRGGGVCVANPGRGTP
jgi:hypothetical protein